MRNISIILVIIFLLMAPLQGEPNKPSSCPELLLGIEQYFALIDSLPSLPSLPPTDIVTNNSKLSGLIKQLKDQYVEADGVIDGLVVSLLMGEHAYLMGEPGGAKSAISDDLLNQVSGRKFSLQFNSRTNESYIVGAVKGEKLLKHGVIEVNAENALVKHEDAVLDEIDKADPGVISSLLGVLNERKARVGSVEIEGALRSAFITSNKTVHQILESFAARGEGEEGTGKAILDRIAVKILVANRFTDNESALKARQRVSQQTMFEDKLDMKIISEEVNKIQIPEEVIRLADILWEKVREKVTIHESEHIEKHMEAPQDNRYPYVKSNLFTSRGQVGPLIKSIKAGKYLEALQNSSKDNSEPVIADNIRIRPEDIKHAQYVMIMQGPVGRAEINGARASAENKHNEDVIKRMKQKVYSGKADEGMRRQLEDLIFERKVFTEECEEVLKLYRETMEELSNNEILNKYRERDINTLSKDELIEYYIEIKRVRDEIEQKLTERDGKRKIESADDVARDKVDKELARISEIISKRVKPDDIKRAEEDAEKRTPKKKNPPKPEPKPELKAITHVELFRTLAKEQGIDEAVFESLLKEKSVAMSFEYVSDPFPKPGKPVIFMMGEGSEVHEVTLTKPFAMKKTPVTQLEWALVMGNNPSKFVEEGIDIMMNGKMIKVDASRPVEQVRWKDVGAYCKRYNEIAKRLGLKDRLRLPTEAEWEFAARGGTQTKFSFGDKDEDLEQYGWSRKNLKDRTQPVAMLKPNQYGLYDVHGNVWEWVEDYYKANYPKNPVTDPTGPTTGAGRVLRGGSWGVDAVDCRSAERSNIRLVLYYDYFIGFRPVRIE